MQPQYVSTITTTTVSGPPSYDKLEQPPTYDETDLRVNLPGKQSIYSAECRCLCNLSQWTMNIIYYMCKEELQLW